MSNELGRFIKYKRGDVSLRDFAKKIGISHSHLDSIEKGFDPKTKKEVNVSSKIVYKLAEALNVDVWDIVFMINGESYEEIVKNRYEQEVETIKSEETIQIPVIGVIPAGQPIEAIENIIGYEEIPKSWTRGNKKYFGLKLKGDSMAPKYLEGDIIIFLQAKSCENGQECAVTVNGYDATFKKIIKTDLGLTLQPLNSNYELKTYSNEDIEKLPITIIGIAKELRRKL